MDLDDASCLSNQHLPTSQERIANSSHYQGQSQSQAINLTRQTQPVHPNLQNAVQHQLSASQFDISSLLKQPSHYFHYLGQRGFDPFDTNLSTKKHSTDQIRTGANYEGFQLAQNSICADTRDIDFLRLKFFHDYKADTNDILTLFSYWQSNFSNFTQPKILSQQVTEMAISPTAGLDRLSRFSGLGSKNATSFANRSRLKAQQTLLNFNSQSFQNNTMTTSQPRKTMKLIDQYPMQTEAEINHNSVGLANLSDVHANLLFPSTSLAH